MEKFFVFYTGVIHQVYLINKLKDLGFPICGVICEPPISRPVFDTSFPYPEERKIFEDQVLFKGVSPEIIDIPMYRVDDINSKETADLIKKIKAQIGIVFGTKKLKPLIIDLFDDFILNIHRGIAKEYRGVDSDFWAIYHHDFKNIGTTIHRVDEKLDTGPYTFMEQMPIARDTKIWQLRGLTTSLGIELLSKTLKNHYNKSLVFHEQKKRGRYYSFFPTIFMEKCTQRFHKYTEKL